MNIIFKANLLNIEEKYIVLELDTFSLPDGSLHTACCVVENIPIDEFAIIDKLKELHAGLVRNYGRRDWNYCEQAIEQLLGKWNRELDSFYQDLLTRIHQLKTQELDETWTPIIAKE